MPDQYLDPSSNLFQLPAIHSVYHTSQTPPHLAWDTYNYCNAPHVNREHYTKPNDPNATLVYLNVVMRHHKRTPDNILPYERDWSGWDCSDFNQMIYGGGTTNIRRETIIPSWHPYAETFWNGTCDSGQLTQQGLEDSIIHGRDFWTVYHEELGFLDTVNVDDIYVRTSTELRTHQVAGGILYGMDPTTDGTAFPVHCQPQRIDSIVPNYKCPAANAIREAYQSIPAWTQHLEANRDLKARLDATLGTADLNDWGIWYDHFFDAFTSRKCHGHPLPCNSTGGCVSEEDAARVFALGDYEYNYIFNAAENASKYVQLTFGVFFYELAQNMRDFQSGQEQHKLKLYIGHDGTMIRLASGLGLGKGKPLRWPALGSEIVFEVWQIQPQEFFVRVLHDGKVVGPLEWVSLENFTSMLDGLVPPNLLRACNEPRDIDLWLD